MNQLLMSAALRYRNKAKPGYVVGDSVQGNEEGIAQGVPIVQSLFGPCFGLSGREIGRAMREMFTKAAVAQAPSSMRLSGMNDSRISSMKCALPSFQQGVTGAILSTPGGKRALERENSLKGMTRFLKRQGSRNSCGDGAKTDKKRKMSVVNAMKSNPLAFVAAKGGETDPTALMNNRRLKQIKTSEADMHSSMRDEAIVTKLMQKVSKSNSRPSIDLDSQRLAELDDMLGIADKSIAQASLSSEASRPVRNARKSVYQQNLEALSSQLAESKDSARSDRSSAYDPSNRVDGDEASPNRGRSPNSSPNGTRGGITHLPPALRVETAQGIQQERLRAKQAATQHPMSSGKPQSSHGVINWLDSFASQQTRGGGSGTLDS